MRLEIGLLIKSKKGRMSAWRGEWENDISGNHMDSVQEQTLAVLARGVIVDNKHNRILLLQRRRHSLTEEDFRTVLAAERKSFWKERSESVQKLPFFSACQTHKSTSGFEFGDQCQFRHTEAGRQPSKKSKKSGGKDQLLY